MALSYDPLELTSKELEQARYWLKEELGLKYKSAPQAVIDWYVNDALSIYKVVESGTSGSKRLSSADVQMLGVEGLNNYAGAAASIDLKGIISDFPGTVKKNVVNNLSQLSMWDRDTENRIEAKAFAAFLTGETRNINSLEEDPAVGANLQDDPVNYMDAKLSQINRKAKQWDIDAENKFVDALQGSVKDVAKFYAGEEVADSLDFRNVNFLTKFDEDGEIDPDKKDYTYIDVVTNIVNLHKSVDSYSGRESAFNGVVTSYSSAIKNDIIKQSYDDYIGSLDFPDDKKIEWFMRSKAAQDFRNAGISNTTFEDQLQELIDNHATESQINKAIEDMASVRIAKHRADYRAKDRSVMLKLREDTTIAVEMDADIYKDTAHKLLETMREDYDGEETAIERLINKYRMPDKSYNNYYKANNGGEFYDPNGEIQTRFRKILRNRSGLSDDDIEYQMALINDYIGINDIMDKANAANKAIGDPNQLNSTLNELVHRTDYGGSLDWKRTTVLDKNNKEVDVFSVKDSRTGTYVTKDDIKDMSRSPEKSRLIRDVELAENLHKNLGNYESKVGALDSAIQAHKTRLQDLINSGKFNSEQTRVLSDNLAQFDKLMHGFYEGHWKGTVTGAKSASESFISSLAAVTRDVEGGVLKKSTANKLRNTIGDIQSGGLLGAGFTGGGGNQLGPASVQSALARLLADKTMNMDDSVKALRLITQKTDLFIAVLPRLEEERAEAFWREFFRNVEKGKVLDVYVISKIREKLKIYTPSYRISEWLDKNAYFGLKINNYRIKNDEGSMGFMKLAEAFDFKFEGKTTTYFVPKAGFGNYFNIVLDGPGNISGKSLELFGGAHFDAVNSLKRFLPRKVSSISAPQASNLLLSTAQLKELFGYVVEGGDSGRLKFLRFFYETFDTDPDFLKNVDRYWDQFGNFVEHARMFWYRATGSEPPKGAEELEFLHSLFIAVHEKGLELDKYGIGSVIGITSKYAGYVQKLYIQLNKYKTIIFDKYGHFISPIFNTRNWIIEKFLRGKTLKMLTAGMAKRLSKGILLAAKKLLGTAISNTIAALLGSVSAGAGVILEKILEPIIRYVIYKLTDAVAGSVKAALKGDVFYAFRRVFGTLNSILAIGIKAILIFLAAPAAFVLLIFLFVVSILGGMSPTDPAIVGQGIGGGGVILGGSGATGQVHSSCGIEVIENASLLNGCTYSQGYRVSASSYDASGADQTGTIRTGPETAAGTGGWGHGSNHYWGIVSGEDCRFGIPSFFLYAPSTGPLGPIPSGNNICGNRSPRDNYYGYALDVVPTGCSSVYLPFISGVDRWSVVDVGQATVGGAVSLVGYTSSGTPRFKLAILHIAPTGIVNQADLAPGTRVAETVDWGTNTHTHYELGVWNGSGFTPVEPETYLCNPGGGPN